MPLTRRDLVRLLSSSTFLLSAGSFATAPAAKNSPAVALDFPQGVASGDPSPTAVMLWTRAVPQNGASEAAVLLQVCTTPDFELPVAEALLMCSAESDYTVRAYVDQLQADKAYFYRFLGANNSVSRLGQTRTAPDPEQAKTLNMAFVSCQNFEQGYYGAWARMIADDQTLPEEQRVQLVLHLGDFIYERSWQARQDGSALSRQLAPLPEGEARGDSRYAKSLADYRHIYRHYLSDPWLQEARARWPFICTWDDHEFSDDNYQSYSHYGPNPKLEAWRKLNANQAWFEYIPCTLNQLAGQAAHDLRKPQLSGDPASDNQKARDSLCIYRRLRWGKHVDIVLTDARSYRSPPCLPEGFAESLGLQMNSKDLVAIADAGREYNKGKPPATLPYGSPPAPNPFKERAAGSCLGEEQRQWLLDSLRSSTATWKLWANPLPLLPLHLDLGSIPFSSYEHSVFNIDAWMGYPHERNTILGGLQTAGVSGLVSLSGDHHMHGAAAIRADFDAPESQPVAVDFSCAGISSTPLFDSVLAVAKDDHPDFAALVEAKHRGEYFPNWNMTLLQGVLSAYSFERLGSTRLAQWLGPNRTNPGLLFADSTANGYGLATFSATDLQLSLVAVAEVQQDFEQAPPVSYRAKFQLPLWEAEEGPALQGPQFEGQPPFPFSLMAG
ncbi:alkaline phosphatase D family protein [Parahaliea sp. F7430]|uniref:Alkaline phosphatase D family protein n=1 Tax=Sediminihaliea albiluteola TaxID=2758564 RepID=A0A7W2TW11_9GAMM|nr:alkaline phosphatase D family protein [Sediminihaliea albiluteola]MBA6412889.1 alkaline phosphatase D family protein [Sediminihaliea albiluteola]